MKCRGIYDIPRVSIQSHTFSDFPCHLGLIETHGLDLVLVFIRGQTSSSRGHLERILICYYYQYTVGFCFMIHALRFVRLLIK